MAVSDGIRRTSLDTVPAKNATRIVNVVDLCVTLTSGNTLCIGIFGCFDVNAISRTRRGTQEASYAFLEAVFVPLKYVNSPIAGLDAGRDVGKALGRRLAEHGAQGDAETLVQSEKRLADFSNQ